MPFFVIAGKTNCTNFAHAVHVAGHLTKFLPRFKYKIVEQDENDWDVWLQILNASNKWRESKSPIIWKEVSRMGGKPYIIGGLSEFWEYCYDYYGFESFLSHANLKKILEEQRFIKSKFEEPKKTCQIVSIIGGWNFNKFLELLIHQIEATVIKGAETILVRLFDEDLYESEYFLEILDEMETILERGRIEVSTSLINTIENCDLMIVVTDYQKLENEPTRDWLQRCYTDMYVLAEEINFHAKRDLRLVLAHPGPVCFTASVLIKYVTKIRLANIVAVTANEGISVIESLSNKTDIPVDQISCPPVWGFCGISSYVDICSIFFVSHIYRPFARALKSIENTKLPNGKMVAELRKFNYLIDDEERVQLEQLQEKVKMLSKINKPPIYSKIRATASLLKIWLHGEPNDEIISAGVCSNGSFGIPPGIVYSQPVILNEKRFWEPFSTFPASRNARCNNNEIIMDVTDIFEKYKLGADYN